MVAVAGGILPVRDATSYDQYALLRASEEALGISTFLGKAAERGRHARRHALLSLPRGSP